MSATVRAGIRRRRDRRRADARPDPRHPAVRRDGPAARRASGRQPHHRGARPRRSAHASGRRPPRPPRGRRAWIRIETVSWRVDAASSLNPCGVGLVPNWTAADTSRVAGTVSRPLSRYQDPVCRRRGSEAENPTHRTPASPQNDTRRDPRPRFPHRTKRERIGRSLVLLLRHLSPFVQAPTHPIPSPARPAESLHCSRRPR
jgi:hypothetical protein